MHILQAKKQNTNVGETERWLSLIGGSSLVAYALSRRNNSGFGLAALGGGLLWRGVTGHCPMYETFGRNTSERGYIKGTGSRAGVPYELGIRVDHQVHIHKPVNELYSFWRELSNLPRFMDHLESVKVINDRLSHWVAKGPAGFNVEWDAEIVNDIPNKVIGWRSLEGADVDNGGSVRFQSEEDGMSTVVMVSLQYNPPAGQLGEWVARMFGENPKKTIAQDFQRFKELMENGSVARAPKRSRSALSPNTRFSDQPKKQWERDTVTTSSEDSFPASDPPSWTPETL